MKQVRKLVATITIIILFSSWTFIQGDDCIVLLPKISGKYEGDCKKGKAHGKGKSVGEDTYEGGFKKGMPDGVGKYTWSSGNIFEGAWKKGLKEGKGKLIIPKENQPDSIVVGFWKNNNYIGKYENPFKIESKSSNINKLRVVKKSIAPNQVELIIMRKNTPVGISNLRINTNAGTFYNKKNVVNTFPLEMEIEFDSKSASGFGAAKEKFTCKVKIMEKGNWVVTVDLTNV